jgi:hypothetical protein
MSPALCGKIRGRANCLLLVQKGQVMEVGEILFDAKSRTKFQSDIVGIPCNGYVRDFFFGQLRPICGYRTTLKALSETLDVSWRIFIIDNAHYRGSFDEFKMPFFGQVIIATSSIGVQFVSYHLWRQMMQKQIAEVYSDIGILVNQYNALIKPFTS